MHAAALGAVSVVLLLALAYALGERAEHAVGQAAIAASLSPDATFTYYFPLLEGGCEPGCLTLATPAPTVELTLTPDVTLSPTPTATPSPSATATLAAESTATPTPAPEVVVLHSVADTFIVEGMSGQADANFGHYPGMFLGYDEQSWLRQRALLQFDLAALPKDALVISATLQVYTHNCFICKPMNVDALRVTGAWGEEEATWNTSLNLAGELYGRGVMVARQRWLSIDLTRLVADWHGATPNYGIMLVGREESPYDWWSIEAREDGAATAPRLVVSYVAP
ncbi:MAG: DNRLRE domain-containing protein [Anaerolineae bacterium]